MPGHVAVGNQLSVDIATDLRVPPAVVDVHDADHVPLERKQEEEEEEEKKTTTHGVVRPRTDTKRGMNTQTTHTSESL